MHTVLARQLRRLGLEASTAPPTQESWHQFIHRVDRTYRDADQDRYRLERSLELCSEEMQARLSQLRKMQADMVETSRRAGMADVAVNVIHNVGNVLNSVNVSAAIIARAVGSTTNRGAERAIALLRAQERPGQFLDEDPRGKKLLTYLEQICERMRAEREEILAELDALSKNVDHIKTIVSQQQSQARSASTMERIALTELLDDGIRAARLESIDGRPVEIVREYQDLLVVEIDRHKVYQIIVNLLTNARDALEDSQGPLRVMLRATRRGKDWVVIEIRDSGVGIAPENASRIFAHGFTTKAQGHGFGLHSSSCAAMELGGKLTVQSEGVGHGALFTLTLPRTRASVDTAAA